jgi:hypothetical protein
MLRPEQVVFLALNRLFSLISAADPQQCSITSPYACPEYIYSVNTCAANQREIDVQKRGWRTAFEHKFWCGGATSVVTCLQVNAQPWLHSLDADSDAYSQEPLKPKGNIFHVCSLFTYQ